MARLAAHSQCARVLYASEGVCRSRNSGAALCALKDWRSWRVGSRSELEKESGHIGLCARNERRRRSCGVHCSQAAAAEAFPWSVEDLEKRFGQAGAKFVEAAGYRIVEMRLHEGSRARVVVQSALVSSYKSRMWHGGLEELLHTAVVPGKDEAQRPTTVGGVEMRVWESEAGSESNLAATECWNVENVRSDPALFVQVILSTTSKKDSAGAVLQFKYVFTLTKDSLSCALITTNIGDSAVSIHGSLQTSIEVNFADGAYALGLQGCKYLPPPPDSSPGAMVLNAEKATETEGGLFSKLRWFSGDKKRNDNNDRTEDGMIIEAEEKVRMKGGFERLYLEASNCVSLLDRGKRRTIHFHNTGFGDIRLSNPGEESGLEDWDSFVCIELARSIQPVHLQPGQEWRAAQQLENPSKDRARESVLRHLKSMKRNLKSLNQVPIHGGTGSVRLFTVEVRQFNAFRSHTRYR